jgi:hypothetical protein
MLHQFGSGRRALMKDRFHELEFLKPKLPEGPAVQTAVVAVAV